MNAELEAIIEAVRTGLQAHFDGLSGDWPDVDRNNPLQDEAPPEGVVMLVDGNTEETEITLSPPRWYLRQHLECQIVVDGDDADERNDNLARIRKEVGKFIKNDRTLGGRLHQMWPTAGDPFNIESDEGRIEGLKGLSLTIILEYETDDPLA